MNLIEKSVRGMIVGSAALLTVFSIASRAESVDASTAAATATATVPASEAKVKGTIELRPNYKVDSKQLFNDTTVEIGYKFSKNVALLYDQSIKNNVSDPSGNTQGLAVTPYTGFTRFLVNNILKTDDGLSLNYENRFYVPVDEGSRNAGMITTMRNYLKLTKEFNKTFSLTLSEVAIVHAFTHGAGVSDGKLSANPFLENRLYLIGSVQITDKLSLSVPIMFHVSKARDVVGVADSGAVSFYAWMWPELGYQINDTFSAGLALQSDNLVRGNDAALTLANGLSKSAVQVFVAATL